jgi:hypothetical protein
VYVTKDLTLASDSSLSSPPDVGCWRIRLSANQRPLRELYGYALRQLRVGANSSLIKFLELQAQHGRGVQKPCCRCAMAVLAFGNRG